jgi:hypothetical protein
MLKDSIVMITGATSGIGLATTKEFLDQGAHLKGKKFLPNSFVRLKFRPIPITVAP